MPKHTAPMLIPYSSLSNSLRSDKSVYSKKGRKNNSDALFGSSLDSVASEMHYDFKPRNENQKKLMDMLMADNPVPIIIACGSSGSGKTCVSLMVALRKLHEGHIKRIVLTRPAVSVDEELGFLPGSLHDKLEPFLIPLYEIMEDVYSPQQIKDMIDDKRIVIAPLSYIRGRTFKDCVVIAEEMQNASPHQCLSLLTRLGANSIMVLTGDLAQSDLKTRTNGLQDLLNRVGEGLKGEIEVVKFVDDDVVRHPVIKTIIKLYQDPQTTYMDRA